MSTPTPTSPTAKGHARVPSEDRRVTVPRRRTKGPLELGDPPFASGPPPDIAPTPTSPPPPQMEMERSRDLTFLQHPANLHPIPNTIVPPPFLSAAPPSTSPSELLSTLHFRAAAIAAANTLTSSSPLPANEILELWYIRLLSLSLLGGPALRIAAQEVQMFSDTPGLTWELRILSIRLHAVGFADWSRCISSYYDLAREARSAALDPKISLEERKVWRRRLGELGVRIANALVELGDLPAAARHIEGLQGNGGTEKALLYVKAGMVNTARKCAPDEGVVEALVKMADGKWKEAEEVWNRLGGGEMERCNRAVCMLYQGRIQEARELLEAVVDGGAVFPSLVFNLATIYDLCGDSSKTLKLQLAEKVAELGRDMTPAVFKM